MTKIVSQQSSHEKHLAKLFILAYLSLLKAVNKLSLVNDALKKLSLTMWLYISDLSRFRDLFATLNKITLYSLGVREKVLKIKIKKPRKSRVKREQQLDFNPLSNPNTVLYLMRVLNIQAICNSAIDASNGLINNTASIVKVIECKEEIIKNSKNETALDFYRLT